MICYHCQQAAEKAIKAVYMALKIPGFHESMIFPFCLNK